VYSGGDVPGEGEHKILRYIRNNKNEPNTTHCIYGLDADLILLGLITHEPHVILLREEVKLGSVRSLPEREYAGDPPKFQILYLNVLREYLQIEFSVIKGLDLERFIDDFVVLMLFVGNDFIPRLPTFEIHEGAVDKFFDLYKAKWHEVGYLSDCGFINWEALNFFIKEFPSFEHKIITDRITSKNKRRSNPAPIKSTQPQMSIREVFHQTKNEEVKNNEESEETEEPEEENNYVNQETENLKLTLEFHLDRGIYHVKKFYYKEMLHIDIDTDEGRDQLQRMIKSYLEGLQWVMYYYFQGVKNWHWYYPYHYAPMISDFSNIYQMLELQDSKLIFPPAEPFRPLEQLMGVIPPRSQHMLPEEYRNLLREPDLQRYFPDYPVIEYDIMCAKIGWESMKIVVPFVPYQLIIERARQLSESRQSKLQNTINKDILYYYDPSEPTRHLETVLPQYLPDFECNIHETFLDYDDSIIFKPEILPGTLEVLPGFPSLKYLHFNPELRAVGINVFQTASQLPSMILNFDKSPLTIEEAYNSLFHKIIYIGYPLQELAYVIGVSNQEKYLPSLNADYLNYLETTLESYLGKIRGTLSDYMSLKQGFTIAGDLGIVVHYLSLKSFSRSKKGLIEPKWDESESYAPLELVMSERQRGHPRDISKAAPGLHEEFPVGSKVIVIKRDMFGYVGEVVGYARDKFNPEGGVEVRIHKKPKMIHDEIKKISGLHFEKYYSLRELSNLVRKPIGLISRLLGSLKIKAKMKGKTKILQIGLNLKNDKEYMAVLRWSRWGGYWNPGSEEWEFSEEAKNLLVEYNSTFPEMWRAIDKCWSDGKRTFYLDDAFGYSRHPFKESERVALWIYKHVSFKIPWTSVYSQYLSDKTIENIRLIIKNSPVETINSIDKSNPGFFYIESKPWTSPFLMRPQEFNLGDRVINICSSYFRYVPFGCEGTIIALIDKGHAEVMFDDIIINDMKGSRLVIPTRYLLNLTVKISAIKRDTSDQSSCGDDINMHDDSSFKPRFGKKPVKDERAEEIMNQILSSFTQNSPTLPKEQIIEIPQERSLNPDAMSFQPLAEESKEPEILSKMFKMSESTTQIPVAPQQKEVPLSVDHLFDIAKSQAEITKATVKTEPKAISVEQLFESAKSQEDTHAASDTNEIPIINQMFERVQISSQEEGKEPKKVEAAKEPEQKVEEEKEPELLQKLFNTTGSQFEAPSGLDFPNP